MNEQKHLQSVYFNPKTSKQQRIAEELLAAIKIFMSKNRLEAADFMTLNNLINQLNMHQKDIPNKVLKSVKNKFAKIQEQYQR